jgi:hypothetical protein
MRRPTSTIVYSFADCLQFVGEKHSINVDDVYSSEKSPALVPKISVRQLLLQHINPGSEKIFTLKENNLPSGYPHVLAGVSEALIFYFGGGLRGQRTVNFM